ncbi:MAG TPA: S16 family serine protease [Acidimicrobiales bacterium]|nr:S16 family serine protease [Acidimicrobiales bacterium]
MPRTGPPKPAPICYITAVARGAETSSRRRLSVRAEVAGWVVVALAGLFVVAGLYHPPYGVVGPGPAVDVRDDVVITGVPSGRPTGPYLLTSVWLSRPSALGLAVAALRHDREVVKIADVHPAAMGPAAFDAYERSMFADSRQLAAAAAARAAGYEPRITGRGARVLWTEDGSPAASRLAAGDVVTAVDGAPVLTKEAFLAAADQGAPGRRVLSVRRGGRLVDVAVERAAGEGIGAVTTTDAMRVELPFTVTFRSRPDFGGPSAGLIYALTIADMLDARDGSRSRAVAATGSITAGGSVKPVRGVQEKAAAARRAGADLFVVPSAEVDDAGGAGLAVRGADTIDEAVRALG